MRRNLLALMASCVMTATALSSGPSALRAEAVSPSQQGRLVIVTAVDRRGAPVAGLTGADFRVRENGRDRPVLDATIATTPMTIALMIDDNGVGLQSIREGAARFVSRLSGRATIALFTTSGRTLRSLDYTDSTASLIGAINKTYARNTPGSFFTDGIVDVANELRAVEARRPVIVSIGVEGQEDFSDTRPPDVMAALQRSGAQVYLIRLGTPTIPQHPDALSPYPRDDSLLDEQVRFNAVLAQAPARTGGRIEQLMIHSGIPQMMEALAAELLAQYELTYATADPTGVDLRFEVSSSQRDVRVRGPQRIGPPR